VVFVLASVYVLYYIYRFTCVEPSLHPWNVVVLSQVLTIVAQAGLELLIFLCQSPECWNYRCVSPYPASSLLY
jgi:hypothetical protein